MQACGFNRSALALAGGLALLGGTAHAFPIDVGSDDVALRWDNTLRYNLGVRANKPDSAILNDSSYDDSDAKFKRGDIVMNRLDILSELDAVYKSRFGARVSADLWYDHAYHDTRDKTGPLFDNPAGNASSAYAGGHYNGYTDHWNRGPGAEVLDAFVFGGVDIGGMPLNVRAGQYTLYWGESLFSFVHGVSYGQGPIDIRKALGVPGIEAKELYKPLPQVSATLQVNEELSFAGQYFLNWRPSVFPDGGTYFGVLDAISGGNSYLINPVAAAGYSQALGVTVAPVPFVKDYGDPRKSGDWGVMSRWTPAALGGATTFGAYYRLYTDKLPQLVLGGVQPATLPFAPAGVVPSSFGLSYRDARVRLIGASATTQVAGMSVSGEVAHRSGGGLLMGAGTFLGSEPVGDTWHALANAIAYFGKTPVFDSAALTAELTYSRLGKVTQNGGNFMSYGYDAADCPKRGTLGCATRDAWGIAAKFEPTWFQVLSGVDMSMPVVFTDGLRGTSPVLFGGYQGNGSYSVGVSGSAKEKYSVTLAYNDSFARHTTGPDAALGNATAVKSVGGIGAQWDRGWVSLTLKTSF